MLKKDTSHPIGIRTTASAGTIFPHSFPASFQTLHLYTNFLQVHLRIDCTRVGITQGSSISNLAGSDGILKPSSSKTILTACTACHKTYLAMYSLENQPHREAGSRDHAM